MSVPSLGEMRVLVVDDDSFMLDLVTITLNKLGLHAVATASSGRDALDKLKNDGIRFDVVLCDLNMPGMDGVEFLRHLAQDSYPGGIILFSGEDKRILETSVRLADAHALNILGSLEKPVLPEPLKALLLSLERNRCHSVKTSAASITESDLRHAIGAGHIHVVYQPKFAVDSRRVVGVEALARWHHPQLGPISPVVFIPLAERSGLIDPLTDLVVLQTLRQGSRWMAEGLDLTLSINLSMDSLHSLELPESIALRAREVGIDPGQIMLEVTESRLLRDIPTTLEILTRLRLKGFGLSIDDFGTGYSTMSQLKQIPFVELKIDRGFVNGACRDASALAILESSVQLARKLGMKVVAEGVESRDDFELLASLAVDQVQGYFIAKPMQGDALADWLSSWPGTGDAVSAGSQGC